MCPNLLLFKLQGDFFRQRNRKTRKLVCFLSHHDVNENEREEADADAYQGVQGHGEVHRRFALGDLLSGLQINESDLKGKAAVQARFFSHINMSCQFEA